MAHQHSTGTSLHRQHYKMGAELDFASSEAYKLFRTNLVFSFLDKEGGKIIGLTSSRPQDGKSTSSINLAYSLAEEGHRVLLIDGDMRRFGLTSALNKPIAPGLSNYLVGNAKDVIYKNVLHENLSLITSGDPPPNPVELIGSSRMKTVLDTLRQRYDYVIVDLPPVNLVSDPLVVSKYLDGVILVVRHAYSMRKEVLEAVRRLKFVNAHILGFVYNCYHKGKTKTYRRYSYDAYGSSSNAYHSVHSDDSNGKSKESE